MSAAIRLHHCPGTRSVRPLWLLYELGVEFELVTLPFDRTLREAAYLALNPAGRVPALEIDGRALFESGAILQVLCERFSPDGLGRPVDHPERMDWLQWLHFAETISGHCQNLTQQHLMLREDHMRSPILTQLEAKRLANTIRAVEGALVGEHVLGGFSAVDIALGQAVEMGRHFVRLEPFPKVAAWFDRLAARPAFARAMEGAEGFYGQAFYPPLEG